MNTDVQITYVNDSMNTDKPTIFVFTKNVDPTFDVLTHGIAWRTMRLIGKGSSSRFIFPAASTVRATWGDGNATQELEAEAGKRYAVLEDNTGIVLQPDGEASKPIAIEVSNQVQVPGGIRAQICKSGKPVLSFELAEQQQACFIPHFTKLYWGLASTIDEGDTLASAVLDTDSFFEQDIEGVSKAIVILTGYPKEGYKFVVENVE